MRGPDRLTADRLHSFPHRVWSYWLVGERARQGLALPLCPAGGDTGMTPYRVRSEKAFQQPARMPVQRRGVFDAELHAVAPGNQQAGASAQAADVFLGLGEEAGRAPVSLHLPGAGGGGAGYWNDFFESGHKLSHFQFSFDELAGGAWQLVQPVDPQQFVAVRSDQREPFGGCRDWEGPHRRGALVGRAVGQGQNQPTVWIARQGERGGGGGRRLRE